MATNLDTTCHHDGTITYWSVYDQAWVRHADTVPDRELAQMMTEERERALRHTMQDGCYAIVTAGRLTAYNAAIARKLYAAKDDAKRAASRMEHVDSIRVIQCPCAAAARAADISDYQDHGCATV